MLQLMLYRFLLMRGSKATVLCSQLAARCAARHREDVVVERLRGVAVDESTNEALHVGSEGCVGLVNQIFAIMRKGNPLHAGPHPGWPGCP